MARTPLETAIARLKEAASRAPGERRSPVVLSIEQARALVELLERLGVK